MLQDGRLASGGADGKIRLWPRDGTGEPVVLSQGSMIVSLLVLADGRLVSGGADGKIKLWPKDGAGEPAVLSHGSLWVESLAVLAAGQRQRRRQDQALAQGRYERAGGVVAR